MTGIAIDQTSVDKLIRRVISDLVDFDMNLLDFQTQLDQIGLVSLDYVTIRVAIEKDFSKEINLDALTNARIETYGQLIDFIIA